MNGFGTYRTFKYNVLISTKHKYTDDQLFAAVNINGFDTGLAFYFTAPSTFKIKDNLTLHFNRSFLLLKTRFKTIAILL